MANYIPDLYRFLRELGENNNRPWFMSRKEEFDQLRALWLADIDRLIASIAEYWPELASQTAKHSAYRIYRDTRFSLDKTPYKTYFSAALCPQGRSAMRPGFYIHMGPEGDRNPIGSGLYGGLWCPDAPALRKLRQAIVDNIEEWEEIVESPEVKSLYPGWVGDKLKRAPKGWPIDHPQVEYLKLKEYGKYRPLGLDFFSDPAWPELAAELLRPLKPLNDFLAYSLDE